MVRQSITTKFLPATDTRGSRIKASASGGKSKTVGYDHALDSPANHEAAARELIKLLKWEDGQWFVGGSSGGAGFVFVDAKGQQPLGM